MLERTGSANDLWRDYCEPSGLRKNLFHRWLDKALGLLGEELLTLRHN